MTPCTHRQSSPPVDSDNRNQTDDEDDDDDDDDVQLFNVMCT